MNASNDSFSCLNCTENENISLWLRIFHGTVLSLLLVASITGNSLVLLLVAFNKTLQYRSVVSSLGLVVADFLITVAWSIQSLANIATNDCPLNQAGCSILGAVTNIAIYARWCTVALITLERFCSIICPFWYMKWSKPLLIVLSIFSWVISIATIIPWLAGLGVYQFRLRYSSCTVSCDLNMACFRFYITLYGTFVCIGGLLPMLLYFSMCVIGQRKAYKMTHIALGTTSTQNVKESQNLHDSGDNLCGKSNSKDGTNGTISSTTKYRPDSISSGTSRGSGGGLEKKIATTFFMIFMNVFLTQLPIYATSALRSSEDIYSQIPLFAHFIFIEIYLLGSVLDPLLIMRNRDFKDAIKTFLRKRSRPNVAHTLLDLVNLGSLLEVAPATTSRAKMRRNSFPVIVLRKTDTTAVEIITKARSYDGCISLDRETRVSIDVLEKKGIQEEGLGRLPEERTLESPQCADKI